MTITNSIENLYEVFSVYKPPAKIMTDNCISCVTEEAEHFFLTKPLPQLNDSLFGLYFYACNIGSFPNKDHIYFIPRMLELYPEQVSNVDFAFVEYFPFAFSLYNYKNSFPDNEKSAIDNFFDAYLIREFFDKNAYQDSHQIIEIAIAGFDVIPFLIKLKSDFEVFSVTKQEIIEYIDLKKVQSKGVHYSSFDEWRNFGTLSQLIAFLNQN